MAKPRHLRNAPIREAILDLRVKARAGLSAEDLASALPALHNAFPIVQEQRGIEAQVQLRPTPGTPHSQVRDLGLQGYRVRSDDGLTIAQLRVDGFTFNRLSPYTRWDAILPAAMAAWQAYVDATQPELISRLALRYINHIPLPPDLDGFDDFLTAGPKLPREWPQYVSGFATQVVVHDPENSLSATVRQSLEPRITTRETTVLLDIDAYHLGQLEPASRDVERIFHDLRELKNRLFFGSLTERTVKEFE